jgi:hypothetical protein
MVAYPASLPQSPLLDGYEEEDQETALRSNMEIGPAKTRSRTTSAVTKIMWPTLLTNAQKTTLQTFYQTTVARGATSFTITEPETAVTITVRIIKAPKYKKVSHDKWGVVLELEKLP